MSSVSIGELSPTEKRALLEQLLHQRAAKPKEFPVSFGQQRLWFLDQLAPGNPFYNVNHALRFDVVIDVGLLERSINQMVRRHEVLRTRFAVRDGQPVQVVEPEVRLEVALIDLEGLPAEQREAEATRLATEEARRPFELDRVPLIRAGLVRLNRTCHVLLLTVHHIVADGWSMQLLFDELTALYAAFAAGRDPDLTPLPIQYADFAVWQRQWLQGDVLEDQLGYWRQQLAGLSVLQLPTDRARPAVQTFAGATQQVRLPAKLTSALKALSRREGLTLFMTLLAGFKVLLARYSDQDDIVVGVPVAGRNRMELEGLIGFFVNTLVMRTNLAGDPPVKEVLARVREVALGSYAHQDVPFEKLVEELQAERDLSRNPLCQVAFQLFAGPGSARPPADTATSGAADTATSGAAATATVLEIERGTSVFDLVMTLWETPDGLAGRVEYNTDLFDDTTITRLLGHFQTLLEGMAQDTSRRISQLPLLTSTEQYQLMVEWNATDAPYPNGTCLHELIHDQATRTPEAIAVTFESTQLTYRELDRRANQLAHLLRAYGVGPDVLVGVCMERSPDLIIALLATLKAGGAYLPLDPAYPTDRLAYMLTDAAVTVLLIDDHLTSSLPTNAHTLCPKRDHHRITTQPDEPPAAGTTPSNLAYVIYTSGSTGSPKAAMLEHHSICNRLFWMQNVYPLSETDRVLQKTPFSFDVSVWEFFWPLMTGARLVIAVPGGHLDSAYLAEVIRDQRITIIHFVPSMLQAFLEEPQIAEHCTSVDRIICSGEALSLNLIDRCLTLLDVTLENLYGPTETAVDVTFWSCERRHDRHVVPIGRPIANVQAYILDRHRNPLPIGVPGELYIGGAGVGRGYLNQPDLTRERFLPDPFSDRPGARLYRTGDLARWLPEGTIEFLGRRDHQVKLRGFRIELGEIEAVLLSHPAVREAVVTLREDTPGQPRLVAYLVGANTDAGSDNIDDSLQTVLRRKLPEYMIPAATVWRSSLPLNSNGKVDRRSLPAPEPLRPLDQPVPPRTALEEFLVGLWVELLRIPSIGIDDNFFEIGGHSILATQLVSRIRSGLRLELPVRSLFEAPTVRTLAARLLDEHQTGQIEHVAQLVLDLSQLTEVEARRLLARRSAPLKEADGDNPKG